MCKSFYHEAFLGFKEFNVKNDRLPIIEKNYLIANRNKDAQDNHGYTPLHVAAGNNQAGAASILLKSGASTTILDNDGHTAKQVAAFLGYTDIVALIP
jgi:ankyrin repeat protein